MKKMKDAGLEGAQLYNRDDLENMKLNGMEQEKGYDLE